MLVICIVLSVLLSNILGRLGLWNWIKDSPFLLTLAVFYTIAIQPFIIAAIINKIWDFLRWGLRKRK